jgi:hypothetical protein
VAVNIYASYSHTTIRENISRTYTFRAKAFHHTPVTKFLTSDFFFESRSSCLVEVQVLITLSMRCLTRQSSIDNSEYTVSIITLFCPGASLS